MALIETSIGTHGGGTYRYVLSSLLIYVYRSLSLET